MIRRLALLFSICGLLATLWFGGQALIRVTAAAGAELDTITHQVTDLSPTAMAFSSKVLDQHGHILSYLGTTKRLYTPLNELPLQTKQAFLATEDARFYQHRGISIRGIVRAFMVNISRGGFVQGGSTITQQTARSLFLHPHKHLSRKLKEGVIALALEQKFTKDEILELYLNRMYFGRGAYGIGAAANRYFATEPNQLNLSQSAYLAGLLKAPSRLARHPELALRRGRLVLRQMLTAGMISTQAYQAAAGATIHLRQRHPAPSSSIAPYFVDALSYELKRYLHHHSMQAGWVIQSTFQPRWQHQLTQLMAKKWRFVTHHAEASPLLRQEAEIAGVVYDAEQHHILALKGGKSYAHSQFNRALYTARPIHTMIMPALGAILMAKHRHRPRQTAIQELIHAQNLTTAAAMMLPYGSATLKALIRQTGHHPDHDGYELMLGYEALTPLTLARLISLLITPPRSGSLPRPTTVRAITPGDHHRTTQAIYIQAAAEFTHPSSPSSSSNLSQLMHSWRCLFSYSSATTANLWSIYVLGSTITVIWLGTERGAVALPRLSIQDHHRYESLGKSLAICKPNAANHTTAPHQSQLTAVATLARSAAQPGSQ